MVIFTPLAGNIFNNISGIFALAGHNIIILMSKFTLVAILLFAGSVFSAASQTTESTKKKIPGFKTAAVFYPLEALRDNFKLGVEHKTSPELGIRALFLYGYGENNILYPEIDNYNSIGAEFQLRYYPTHSNPSLYAGLLAGARAINATSYQYDYNAGVFPLPILERKYSAGQFNIGVMGGLNSIIMQRFIFDTYIGIGPNIPTGSYRILPDENTNINYPPLPSDYRNIVPGLRKGMKMTFSLNGGVILFK